MSYFQRLESYTCLTWLSLKLTSRVLLVLDWWLMFSKGRLAGARLLTGTANWLPLRLLLPLRLVLLPLNQRRQVVITVVPPYLRMPYYLLIPPLCSFSLRYWINSGCFSGLTIEDLFSSLGIWMIFVSQTQIFTSQQERTLLSWSLFKQV